MGVGGQRHDPAALPPGKRNLTYCIRGWVGPRTGLEGCGKSRPQRDLIPVPIVTVNVRIIIQNTFFN
jgi:hypothetical protein